MGKTINQDYNYKDAMQILKDKPKKRAMIMARNAEASIKIAAGRLLHKTGVVQETDEKISAAQAELKAGLNSPAILKAQIDMIKDHAEVLNARITELQNQKDAKGGALKPELEQQLKGYKAKVEELTEQRKEVALKLKDINKE